MSYAVSAALQAAIYDRLSNHAALVALVGGAVYDALPAGPLPPIYVSLGPEKVRDRSDRSGAGADHDVAVSVITSSDGFQGAKAAAAAVGDALLNADLPLTRGRLVDLAFLKARARREGRSGVRRIDLNFRVRVADE